MLMTNVDRMLDLLKDKKMHPIPEVAKTLKVPEKAIEKVAKYLEEEGILSISYKLMTPNVVLKDLGKIAEYSGKTEQASEIKSSLVQGKTAVSSPARPDTSQSSLLKRVNDLISSIKKDIRKGKIKVAAAKYNYLRDVYYKRLDSQNKERVYNELIETYSYFKKGSGNASQSA